VVVSGFCSIGEHSFLGVNSCVADYVRVAAYNYIAMGTVLNRNTEEDAVYSGNPADKSLVTARRFCKV
jgi:carbonic anhydrase/acetyltransferase-like protein (isoleucine patch superfamily)